MNPQTKKYASAWDKLCRLLEDGVDADRVKTQAAAIVDMPHAMTWDDVSDEAINHYYDLARECVLADDLDRFGLCKMLEDDTPMYLRICDRREATARRAERQRERYRRRDGFASSHRP